MQLSKAGSKRGREEERNLKGKRISPQEAGETATQKKYQSSSLKKCFESFLIALTSEVFKESADLLKNRGRRSLKSREGNLQ